MSHENHVLRAENSILLASTALLLFIYTSILGQFPSYLTKLSNHHFCFHTRSTVRIFPMWTPVLESSDSASVPPEQSKNLISRDTFKGLLNVAVPGIQPWALNCMCGRCRQSLQGVPGKFPPLLLDDFNLHISLKSSFCCGSFLPGLPFPFWFPCRWRREKRTGICVKLNLQINNLWWHRRTNIQHGDISEEKARRDQRGSGRATSSHLRRWTYDHSESQHSLVFWVTFPNMSMAFGNTKGEFLSVVTGILFAARTGFLMAAPMVKLRVGGVINED